MAINVPAIALARGEVAPDNREVLWEDTSNMNLPFYERIKSYDSNSQQWRMVTQFPLELLNELRKVDGDGSGLDANFLQGRTVNDIIQLAKDGSFTLPSGFIFVGDTLGNATARALSGDATLQNTGALILASTGVTAGTYNLASLTIDAKGRITNAVSYTINVNDIPELPQSKITGLVTDLNGKQNTLVSGTNIKTLNGDSLLGSGDVSLPPPVWGAITGTLSAQTDLQTALDNAGQNIYNGTDVTPLTKRSKIRFTDFLGAVDDAIEEETVVSLDTNITKDVNTSRFGLNLSDEVDLKIPHERLTVGDVNGNATNLTGTEGNLIGFKEDNKITQFEGIEAFNILKETGITANKQLALIGIDGVASNLKATFMIDEILVINTTANSVDVSVGSTAGGTDIANAITIGANATVVLTLGTRYFSSTLGQNLFISSGSWNSANVTISVTVKKIHYV
jgi:hypothetical protein